MDDYSACRIKHFIENEKEIKSGMKEQLTLRQWSTPSKHKHFNQLQNLNVNVIGADCKVPYVQLATNVVRSFSQRIMPKLMFPPMITINSSLEITVQYIVRAAKWIHKLAQSPSNGWPFQFDLCFANGQPHFNHDPLYEDSDDADDDNDKEDEVNDYVDYIGDIAGKLRTNKLQYIESELDIKDQDDGIFDRLYGEFVDLQGDEQSYLMNKRLVTMVDRRKQAQELNVDSADTIFMYEPPKDCRDIPKDAVPEWCFSSSKSCLLPAANVEDDEKYDFEGGHRLQYHNVTSQTSDSSLLTLSFYVKTAKVIKVYLYYNGQCMRFMPEDIKTVLPMMFNMEYGENAEWIQREKEVNDNIEQLTCCLKDVEFQAFRQSYM